MISKHIGNIKYKIKNDKILQAVYANLMGAAAAKAVGFVTSFAAIPLTIEYLQPELYGVWIVIISLASMFQLMDCGVGNLLISKTATHLAEGELTSIKKTLLSSMSVAAVLGFAVLMILFFVSIFFEINSIFSIKENEKESFKAGLYIFAILTALNNVVNVGQAVRLGMQEGYKNSKINILGYIGNYGLIYAGVRYDIGFAGLICASSLGSFIANAFNITSLINVLPGKIKLFDGLNRGFVGGNLNYFVLQACSVIAANIPSFIIPRYDSLQSLTEYNIALRVFTIPSMVLNLVFSGLWAGYAIAKAKNDWIWIGKIFKKTILWSSIFSTVLSLVLYIYVEEIINLMGAGKIQLTLSLTFGMLIWGAIAGLGGTLASMLNGIDELKPQVYVTVGALLINAELTWYFVNQISSDAAIYGAVISSIISYTILTVISFKLINEKNSSIVR